MKILHRLQCNKAVHGPPVPFSHSCVHSSLIQSLIYSAHVFAEGPVQGWGCCHGGGGGTVAPEGAPVNFTASSQEGGERLWSLSRARLGKASWVMRAEVGAARRSPGSPERRPPRCGGSGQVRAREWRWAQGLAGAVEGGCVGPQDTWGPWDRRETLMQCLPVGSLPLHTPVLELPPGHTVLSCGPFRVGPKVLASLGQPHRSLA